MKLKELPTYLTDTLLSREPGEFRNPVVRWFVRQYRLLFYTARGMREHDTFVRSAALTFYTLISVVPIVAVIFAVVKGFGLADGLEQELYGIFPRNPEIVDYLVSFADRVFGSIESAFNNIWEVKVTRNVARQWTDYISVVLIGPLLWIVANALGSYAEELLGFRDSVFYGLLSKAASGVLIWLMFTLLYLIIPNTRVRFTSALTAGLVAGTLFILFQWGYIYVQRWMTSYNAIYGSFAALPLFLLWLQLSWEILLFGGELSFAYQNIARFNEERESLRISYDQRRKVLLAVMLLVVRHFRREGGTMAAEQIRARMNLPTRILNDVLYQLVQARLLIAVRKGDGERDEGYVPGQDINSLTLYGVLEAVEDAGETAFALNESLELACVDRELEMVKVGARDSGDNVRLVDIPE